MCDLLVVIDLGKGGLGHWNKIRQLGYLACLSKLNREAPVDMMLEPQNNGGQNIDPFLCQMPRIAFLFMLEMVAKYQNGPFFVPVS